MNNFFASLEVVDIDQIVLGTRKDNVGPYQFDQDPACGYSQTVTIDNLPAFVSHNAPISSDFSIEQISDVSLVGSYPVTIRSEI